MLGKAERLIAWRYLKPPGGYRIAETCGSGERVVAITLAAGGGPIAKRAEAHFAVVDDLHCSGRRAERPFALATREARGGILRGATT